jgi:hypothetical protein
MEYDSKEEEAFDAWLHEAEKANIVTGIRYHPEPFLLSRRVSMKVKEILKTKTKIIDKFLLHPHKYTTDFSFSISSRNLSNFFITYSGVCFVDIKGSFSKHGDQKQFSINQKWVYDKYGIYINKVVPEKLFTRTFLPESCRLTPKTRKHVKKYIGCKNIKEFMIQEGLRDT